jgi:hypothetical protein
VILFTIFVGATLAFWWAIELKRNEYHGIAALCYIMVLLWGMYMVTFI